jgi:Mg-chelatase subunit ChlD
MSFLSPWFLFGAAAIAGPILFHLIRRIVRERMAFSSLMFLKPTPPKLTRRRRLEHLWLLLLRCLCLLLLALGFARPFFARDNTLPAAVGENRQLILLVDTSASMRRDGVWDKARALAEKYLAQTTPADQVAVLTFDRQPQTLVNFSEWSSWAVDQRAPLAQQRLTAASPSWMGTQLGLALTSAAEKFREDFTSGKPASHHELVLISDLQEGAKLDGLQGHDWPTGVKVILERVDAKPQANAGLEIQNASGATAGDGKPARVRVINARDSNREKFQLNWQLENGTAAAGEPMEIYLPPGQVRTFSAPKLPAGTTAAQLQLSGDEVAFDNRSFYAAAEAEHLTIVWFGLDADNDPAKMRYYMQRVFPETPGRQVKVISPSVQQAFSPELLNQAAFAVIPGRLAPEEITITHDWLARGKTALFVVTDEQAAPALAALTGLPEIKITEAVGDYALLGDIDFKHPIFAPFADPRFSDFTHIHFWKHRRMEIPATAQSRVLAKFDDGSPALAQIPVGSGNLLVLAAGWNPADSQLALSSKFPPLMQTMLDWSGGAVPARFQFQTGDSIPSPASTGTPSASPVASGGAKPASGTPALPEVQWKKPDGKAESLAAEKPFTETDLPGIYVATFAGKERRFAVNLPLDESRTAPQSPDELARLGVPLETTQEFPIAKTLAVQHHLQQAELESRQKLWRWLIVGVLAVMFGEIILSGWLARREKTVEVTT